MEQVLILTPRIESNQLQTVILAFVVIHANQKIVKRVTRLKITDSRSPVMMTGQIFFSPDKPRFWTVKLMNVIIIFCPWNIELRWQYGIVVRVFAGKLVKNSFTRCSVPFRDFRPFYVRLYIPSVSSYGGVGRLQGSSYICISVKLDPFRCPARDRKSPPKRRTTLNIFGKEVDFG